MRLQECWASAVPGISVDVECGLVEVGPLACERDWNQFRQLIRPGFPACRVQGMSSSDSDALPEWVHAYSSPAAAAGAKRKTTIDLADSSDDEHGPPPATTQSPEAAAQPAGAGAKHTAAQPVAASATQPALAATSAQLPPGKWPAFAALIWEVLAALCSLLVCHQTGQCLCAAASIAPAVTNPSCIRPSGLSHSVHCITRPLPGYSVPCGPQASGESASLESCLLQGVKRDRVNP